MGKRDVSKKYDLLFGLSSLEKMTAFSEVRTLRIFYIILLFPRKKNLSILYALFYFYFKNSVFKGILDRAKFRIFYEQK